MQFLGDIEKSLKKVEKWVEDHDYMGYEPFDGLLSFLHPLTLGNIFTERILIQTVRQSPINLRPILGIKPQPSTKGQGYMAWGYLNMFKITGKNSYKDKAIRCLEWLMKNKAPHHKHYSWGNNFDISSRGGRLQRLEPIIVWTSLIGQVFLDAYEILQQERFLDVALSICEWILNLPREQTNKGSCLSYVAFGQESVHNSNMLGAAMLGRSTKYTGDKKTLIVAKNAMEYSCSRQHLDGSWYYGEEKKLHWIDNFHTCYNLDSLKCYIESIRDQKYKENLNKGFSYFINTFFEGNGRPKYYHNRSYPIDSQCASQAIDTLVNFSDYDKEALPLACRVAKWTIDHMQDKDGHFYYRKYPLGIKAKAPMLHWAQATTYKALTLLYLKLKQKEHNI